MAALVEVAPFNRDSGRPRGKRKVGEGGERCAKCCAWPPPPRCNPVIRAFYLQLAEAGKTAKVALGACLRKLLVILNAMVHRGRPWTPALAPPCPPQLLPRTHYPCSTVGSPGRG